MSASEAVVAPFVEDGRTVDVCAMELDASAVDASVVEAATDVARDAFVDSISIGDEELLINMYL